MKKLKERRMAAGLSQSQLAEKTGINVRVIQHYEQGTKNFDHARIDKILNVCLVLNCELKDILESDEYIKLYKDYKKSML